ncbi:ABC transporter permease [Fibrobacterales bacterium]|nr:ABC transporter permease [Fibrobacterales bacterium]
MIKTNHFSFPDFTNLSKGDKELSAILKGLKTSPIEISMKNITTLSVAESATIRQLMRTSNLEAQKITWSDITPQINNKMSSIREAQIPDEGRVRRGWFEKWIDQVLSIWNEFLELTHLLVEGFWSLGTGLLGQHSKGIPGELSRQLLKLGVGAVPIVIMLAFLIGLTLAVQSAMQLEKFGAGVYLARGVGISMITEIGPLMAAIIVAGRSGSAIAAEISTMVVQDEVRALHVMGVSPVSFLLRPRLAALLIAQPLLTVLAQLAGIFAGLLVGLFVVGLPASLFLGELQNAITPTFFIQSMIKAATFGVLIALIGVRMGLTASGGAGAVGKQTTTCVVACISAIIISDALFSFVFY